MYAEAVEAMKDAVRIKPDDAEVLFTLGMLYDDAREEALAMDAMQKVLVLDPGHANALNYIGYTFAEKGIRLDEAEAYIKKALEIRPESGHILDSLGWVYYKKGNFDRAVAELEKAIKYLPKDPIVMENPGDAYWKRSSKDKALISYETAAALDPGNSEIKNKIEKLKEEI